jgi:hypothetical protein
LLQCYTKRPLINLILSIFTRERGNHRNNLGKPRKKRGIRRL